jgi:hypothetical protein
MVKYFKTLLKTLIEIQKSLKEIESCVTTNTRQYGKRKYLSTGSWND